MQCEYRRWSPGRRVEKDSRGAVLCVRCPTTGTGAWCCQPGLVLPDAMAEDEVSAVPEPAPRDSRLAIRSLRLENFKSYGGVVDVGPFHKSFSSIVGPNGSGKSNVIDAMLFVFGRRAKQLRHSKMRELLHHSSTFPDVQSATVTVFFHEIIDTGPGDDDFEVVAGSSFAVARRAFRNDTSKYYIDEKDVKMTAVIELLKSKGVDLDNNRFLILQGEVEQIAMMKPKAVMAHEDGLLEYLEDIIGSNRHIEAIDAAAASVESMNEERSHKLNRVKAVERERDSLEDAKTEAEDFLDKEKELLSKRLLLNAAMYVERKAALEVHVREEGIANEKLNTFKTDVVDKEHIVHELEKDFNDTKKETDQVAKALNKAKDEYSSFERKDIKLREDIKALKSKEKKLKQTVDRETKRAEESQQQAADCIAEKEEAEKTTSVLETELVEAQANLDTVQKQVRSDTAPIRSQLEDKQKELMPYTNTVNNCKRELEVAKSELALLVNKMEQPGQDFAQAQQTLKSLRENMLVAKKTTTSLVTERNENEQQSATVKSQISANRKKVNELTATVSELRRRTEELKAANADVSTRSKLHAALLDASRNGRLSGIVGRLGDLASVDQKYAVAVGAAAGSTLDSIVVETAECAQACIHMLRSENLGRATFVILDKIEYLRGQMSRWSNSECAADGPRLFDHVTIPQSSNQTALYYALRDSLVAKNLEDARRMAFKPTRKNRVVTLAGELIESSGAMTGGGRGPPRHRLGKSAGADIDADPRAAQRVSHQLEAALIELAAAETSFRGLEESLRNCSIRAESHSMLQTKAELEFDSLKSRVSMLETKTLPVLRKKSEAAERACMDTQSPDSCRRRELEAGVQSQDELYATARAACQGLEDEIAVLQQRIVAAGGQKLQAAKDGVEHLRKGISESRSAASKASSRSSAISNTSEKARKAAEYAIADVQTVKRERTIAKEQSTAMLDDAEKVLATYKETEALHNESTRKLHEIHSKYSLAKEDLKAQRRTEVALTEAVSNARRLVSTDNVDLRSLRKKRKAAKRELERLAMMSTELVMADGDASEAANSPSEHECEDDSEIKNDTEVADDHAKENVDDVVEEDEEMKSLTTHEQKQLAREITVLEGTISNLKPNLGAIAEYQDKELEYKAQVDELDSLTARRDSARRENDALRKARLDEFMQGFSQITLKLKELYQMITLGGDAELELVDSLDPFSEGIVFSVRPPKKSWKNISNLSGGEKTLSSLALVFALHHFKPTPLYFLDEIDAALDFKNVSIVANYVKERTKNAQFIIISLRNNMFELADRLVGIYKTHNSTKSVTVNPKAFVLPEKDPSVRLPAAEMT